jgi:hypothetical protein
MMSMTCRIRSGVPTDEPPNLRTFMAASTKCEDRLQGSEVGLPVKQLVIVQPQPSVLDGVGISMTLWRPLSVMPST